MAFEIQSNTNCLKKSIGDRDYLFRFVLGNTKWNFLIVSYHRREFASTGAELDVSRWPNNCFRRIYLTAYVGEYYPKGGLKETELPRSVSIRKIAPSEETQCNVVNNSPRIKTRVKVANFIVASYSV